jgi:hypothetical protein
MDSVKARRRTGVLIAASALLLALPAPGLAITPVDGGAFAITPFDINVGPGDQYDPHVSGDLASYTSNNTIRLYDFVTGADEELAGDANAAFQLSYVSGGRVAFARFDYDTGDIQITVADTGMTTTTAIAGPPGTLWSGPAIGGDTVAFIDGTLAPSDVLAVRLPSTVPVNVTSDDRIDQRLNASPSGDVIVWESCDSLGSNCDVHQATWSGSAWTTASITANATPEANPDTDGAILAYDATRPEGRRIHWQPVGGGPEDRIDVAGEQRNPSVAAGLISFESVAPGEVAADLYLYQVATNRLFRVTTTPWNETLNDVDVLADGRVRLVWSSGAVNDRDVHGATIELPPVGPSFTFGGFESPVDPRPTLNSVKAGGAVPVKFSLGGDFGLSIFAGGNPRSQVIACDSTADVDPIEQTVAAGGSSLAYNAVTGLYSYVWKTDRAWKGSCRQLVLGFADGSVARANFTFK